MPKTRLCPICETDIIHLERYPRQVCRDCAGRVGDENGRAVAFDINWSGGVAARYHDTGDRYLQPFVYIDGFKCRAEEDRFGRGIVIQIAND